MRYTCFHCGRGDANCKSGWVRSSSSRHDSDQVEETKLTFQIEGLCDDCYKRVANKLTDFFSFSALT